MNKKKIPPPKFNSTAKESDRQLLRVYEKEVDLELIKKQNLVLTVTTNQRLNLSKISQKFLECTRKQPDNLSAAVIRFQIPPDNKKISCNVFGSGKLVITGAKNLYSALLCIHNTLRKIRKSLNSPVRGASISLKNIVMTMKMPHKLDLSTFSREWRHCCTYNPKKFPGVIMSFPGTNKPVSNIFKSGSVVIPGPSDKDYALEGCSYVYNIIKKYQIIPETKKIKGAGQKLGDFKKQKLRKNSPLKNIKKSSRN